jgi:hypothetical protein
VFFHEAALEALGEAIKPYLRESARGAHVQCEGIDTAGALIEMTLKRQDREGRWTVIELMVPTNMVRMIVSCQSDGTFGFGPRETEPVPVAVLPPVGPTGEPPAAVPGAVPDGSRLPATALGNEDPEG